jgi:hypothetical protein
MYFFTHKNVTKLAAVWAGNLRSEIWKKIILDSDPGVKKHRIPDPQHSYICKHTIIKVLNETLRILEKKLYVKLVQWSSLFNVIHIGFLQGLIRM